MVPFSRYPRNKDCTFFSRLERSGDGGNCWAWWPSRRFFCKLSSRLLLRISTMLSSLLLRPSSASTATLYLFRRTSVLVFGLSDMLACQVRFHQTLNNRTSRITVKSISRRLRISNKNPSDRIYKWELEDYAFRRVWILIFRGIFIVTGLQNK